MSEIPLNILGCAGSLRKGSYSAALLVEIAALAAAASSNMRITPHPLQDVPLYNADLEPTPGAAPAGVVAFRRAIAESDGLVIVSPEYNYGISGVLKNALDWASRPAYKSVLVGKPVLIVTNSPGLLGGVRAQDQLRQTLTATLARVVLRAEIAVSGVAAKLATGRLTDEPTIGFLKEGLADLAAEIARSRK